MKDLPEVVQLSLGFGPAPAESCSHQLLWPPSQGALHTGKFFLGGN